MNMFTPGKSFVLEQSILLGMNNRKLIGRTGTLLLYVVQFSPGFSRPYFSFRVSTPLLPT